MSSFSDLAGLYAAQGRLSFEDASMWMQLLLDNATTPAQVGAFLGLVCPTQVDPETLAGFASFLRDQAIQHDFPHSVDTCGTGGGIPSFNLSTAAAFIAAGAGVTIAKHGNRAVTSKFGSADVLERLGIPIPVPSAEQVLERVGISFFYAPTFHPILAKVGPVRRELGFRTVFNLLGPMLNPGNAKKQIIGVWDRSLVPIVGGAMQQLGDCEVYVVCGESGLDEVDPTHETIYAHITHGNLASGKLSSQDFGLVPAPAEAIEPSESPELDLLASIEDVDSPRFLAVAPSAALTISLGLGVSYIDGGKLAVESVRSGAARAKLTSLVKEANR